MATNINDTIAELNRADELLNRYVYLGDEIDASKEKIKYDLKSIRNEYYPDIPKHPLAFDALHPEVEPFESSNAKWIKISLIGIVVSLVIWIISKVSIELYMLGFYSFVAAIVFAVILFLRNSNLNTEKIKYDSNVNRRALFEKCINELHDENIMEFQRSLDDFRTQYQIYSHKYDECYENYKQQKNELINEKDEVADEIEKITVISMDYLHLAGDVSKLLSSGRADTLKEALNLAIAEERDNEYHAMKLAEEARRTEIAEQQAYENRLHNQRMEREAATQARAAQAQLKATEQQNAQLKKILENQNKK